MRLPSPLTDTSQNRESELNELNLVRSMTGGVGATGASSTMISSAFTDSRLVGVTGCLSSRNLGPSNHCVLLIKLLNFRPRVNESAGFSLEVTWLMGN